MVINATSATISGKLYSGGTATNNTAAPIITLGNGTTNGVLTVNRVELGDQNGSAASGHKLEVKSGYTLKVTGSTNTIQQNTTQYKDNSFMVSEWNNSTTMEWGQGSRSEYKKVTPFAVFS